MQPARLGPNPQDLLRGWTDGGVQLLSRNVALGNTSAVTVPFTSSQLNAMVGIFIDRQDGDSYE
jgi:hypothetical protein